MIFFVLISCLLFPNSRFKVVFFTEFKIQNYIYSYITTLSHLQIITFSNCHIIFDFDTIASASQSLSRRESSHHHIFKSSYLYFLYSFFLSGGVNFNDHWNSYRDLVSFYFSILFYFRYRYNKITPLDLYCYFYSSINKEKRAELGYTNIAQNIKFIVRFRPKFRLSSTISNRNSGYKPIIKELSYWWNPSYLQSITKLWKVFM